MFKYSYTLLFAFFMQFIHAQEQKTIIIEAAGFGDKDEVKYPDASILTRNDSEQVRISHEGITMWCDQAIFYGKDEFIEAYGNVVMKQGDTLNLNAKYAEYSAKTKLAFAKGDVVLTDPQTKLTTDVLYFDRVNQQSYYKTGGTVVRDTSGTITSRIGRYYMNESKYRFVDSVKLVNKNYTLKTRHLDFYSDNGHAYMYGPSTIVSDSSKIYSERGFYNTQKDFGYFMNKSRIDYDNRVIVGDSMYFNRNKNFASASNNIKITDTINNSIIKGHYAEVFKAKDSTFITKRALAIMMQDKDSTYVHADTLMVTGKAGKRITRGFRNAKIFKRDMSGKADSIHIDEQSNLTKLINLGELAPKDAFAIKRRPILWNERNQMTGDTIHIKYDGKTEKIDSLIVFEKAFLINKDTLGLGYNQIAGKRLIGLFNDENKLEEVYIRKNAESIYFARNDENELVGIEKSKSADIYMFFDKGDIVELRKKNQVGGKLHREEDIPENARKLKGFDWREDERPKSVNDLFKDDPPLELPKIKGLDPYDDQEDFFGEELLKRIKKADKEEERKVKNKDSKEGSVKDKPLKASRQLPKKYQKPRKNPKRIKGVK